MREVHHERGDNDTDNDDAHQCFSQPVLDPFGSMT